MKKSKLLTLALIIGVGGLIGCFKSKNYSHIPKPINMEINNLKQNYQDSMEILYQKQADFLENYWKNPKDHRNLKDSISVYHKKMRELRKEMESLED